MEWGFVAYSLVYGLKIIGVLFRNRTFSKSSNILWWLASILQVLVLFLWWRKNQGTQAPWLNPLEGALFLLTLLGPLTLVFQKYLDRKALEQDLYSVDMTWFPAAMTLMLALAIRVLIKQDFASLTLSQKTFSYTAHLFFFYFSMALLVLLGGASLTQLMSQRGATLSAWLAGLWLIWIPLGGVFMWPEGTQWVLVSVGAGWALFLLVGWVLMPWLRWSKFTKLTLHFNQALFVICWLGIFYAMSKIRGEAAHGMGASSFLWLMALLGPIAIVGIRKKAMEERVEVPLVGLLHGALVSLSLYLLFGAFYSSVTFGHYWSWGGLQTQGPTGVLVLCSWIVYLFIWLWSQQLGSWWNKRVALLCAFGFYLVFFLGSVSFN